MTDGRVIQIACASHPGVASLFALTDEGRIFALVGVDGKARPWIELDLPEAEKENDDGD